ncbi:CBS domain-containing protein [Clostridium sp. D2Q-11]|uniref:CBS domain-containing protein n=1 Tax=Anaeromonas frigoriresistens TaxID=2683708 RepID=A0A942UTM2_9FIRM|nr:CBS domain-containing protein [Anaeromonas frigoriresistens]MBS4538348.1 CBS domain-containing protein [Anaeromonas frigoriresistens]
MHVAFFLTPKEEIVWLESDFTVRQTMEKMEYHRYSAIPIIDDNGKYIGTITEGDLLWKLKKSMDITFKETSNLLLKDVERHRDHKSISINSQIEELKALAINQSFIPVVDDQGIFIGIIKRSTILQHFFK